MIKQTNASDAILADKAYKLVRAEMDGCNLAIKDRAQILREIVEGRALIAINATRQVFGYISFHEWRAAIEIMSLVVDKNYRHRGWGNKLVIAVLNYLRMAFPAKNIIAMANQNSAPIILRHGFSPYSKFSIEDEIKEACAGCQEEKIFPNCHCQPLIYLKPVLTRIVERGLEHDYDNQLFDLYCQIWREPPWNEFFWTAERVSADLELALKHPKSICLIALNEKSVQGFTWGHNVDYAELRLIAGHDFLDVFCGRKLFYISELGVNAKFRGQGIGKKLTAAIINFARSVQREIILLRTDKDALPAQTLYKKAGFVPLMIPDANHPSRLYWALNLKQ